MPFEEIVKELEKQDAVIDRAQQTKKELYQKLLDADTDLITVYYRKGREHDCRYRLYLFAD